MLKQFLLKLECGHRVRTHVVLVLQRPNDEHYVYCPSCRQRNRFAPYSTAWGQVYSVTEIPDELHDVSSRLPLVMPDEIMRLQPSVPRHRKRPFPYVNGVR